MDDLPSHPDPDPDPDPIPDPHVVPESESLGGGKPAEHIASRINISAGDNVRAKPNVAGITAGGVSLMLMLNVRGVHNGALTASGIPIKLKTEYVMVAGSDGSPPSKSSLTGIRLLLS